MADYTEEQSKDWRVRREEKIRAIALQLKELIVADESDCFAEDGLKIGFDGWIDLEKLAEWVWVRLG